MRLIHESIPLGDARTRPGDCLDCQARRSPAGDCPNCEAEHEQLVTRVTEHCGSPPEIERIHALLEQGLYRVVINALMLRLQVDACDHEALELYARVLLDFDQNTDALAVLERARACGAGPRTLHSLGVALANSGKPREAIRVYRQYMAAAPDERHAPVISNIGGCFSALGQPLKGERYHRRAIALEPDNPALRWNLFANLYRQGRREDAVAELEGMAELTEIRAREREGLHALIGQVRAEIERGKVIARMRELDPNAVIIEVVVPGPEPRDF